MKKIILIALLIIIFAVIACKSIFENEICGFYGICEWITYLFIPPICYIIASFFKKIKKSFVALSALTLGICIPLLLNNGDWAANFFLQKVAATLLGSITTYLAFRKYDNL